MKNWIMAGFVAVSMGLGGCAAEVQEGDEEALSEEAISIGASLVGHYSEEQSPPRPGFKRLALLSDGTFTLDIDTGIRCPMAPCRSFEHLAGRYRATRSSIYLTRGPSAEASTNYGRYAYVQSGKRLTLSRTSGPRESTSFKKADPLVNSRTASLSAASVALSTDPPVPVGSNCKPNDKSFRLDVDARRMTYDVCEQGQSNAPYLRRTSSAKLSQTQVDRIFLAYHDLSLDAEGGCDAPGAPFLSVGITQSGRTERRYRDARIECGEPGQYVSHIESPMRAFENALVSVGGR